jgi:hypothetical protein
MHEAQAFFVVVTVLALFMAPTWLAPRGRRWSVGLVNVLLGWSIIFWVVALVMAVRARETAAHRRGEFEK